MLETINNELWVDGIPAASLAKTFGTPLYVYSYEMIQRKINELKTEFIDRYDSVRVAYAAKAFTCSAIFKIMMDAGFCIDVVSGGELFTAISMGFPPERIEFNGNNKSTEELKMALDYGIGRIIIDSADELSKLIQITEERKQTIKVLLRITPGVSVDSHDYIVTGKKDSKFGVPADKKIIYPMIEEMQRNKFIDLLGFHFHIGSQLLTNESHISALEMILSIVLESKTDIEFVTKELNFGGGFGINYVDESAKPFHYYINPMMNILHTFCTENKLAIPEVVIEPGRSLVGEAGITLYEVGVSKNIPGIRKYVSVDGGMGDNIRPALYQAKYSAACVDRIKSNTNETVTISGKYCESGDILINDISLPLLETGDIIAVFSTGAYGYSMANNYNRNLIPGVVLVRESKADFIIKPQTYEDLLRNDTIPDFIE